MLTTRFTDLVGCTLPVQQAAIGAAATPELAAAVSNAGGLGMIGTARTGAGSIAVLDRLIDETLALTDRPFGVNFLINPEYIDDIEAGSFARAARRARVVEFFWAWPDPRLVETVHAEGALVCWQVGSREEASAGADAGVDLIIAQGTEAGGHVRGEIGTLALLEEVLPEVDAVVIAAGGIGSGRALAAVLAAGAQGARVGTRFVAAQEAGAHPAYVAELIAASASDTVLGRTFISGWDAPGRTLRTCVEAAQAFVGDVVGEVPSLDGSRVPLRRFAPDVVTVGASGSVHAMPLWAGESVSAVTRVQPAAQILAELAAEATDLLQRWGDRQAPDPASH